MHSVLSKTRTDKSHARRKRPRHGRRRRPPWSRNRKFSSSFPTISGMRFSLAGELSKQKMIKDEKLREKLLVSQMSSMPEEAKRSEMRMISAGLVKARADGTLSHGTMLSIFSCSNFKNWRQVAVHLKGIHDVVRLWHISAKCITKPGKRRLCRTRLGHIMDMLSVPRWRSRIIRIPHFLDKNKCRSLLMNAIRDMWPNNSAMWSWMMSQTKFVTGQTKKWKTDKVKSTFAEQWI